MKNYVHLSLLPEMKKVYQSADIKVTTIGEVEGMIPMVENPALKFVSEIIGTKGAEHVAFGTEAGIYQSYGIDCVVCGPGSIEQAHKADEFITIDQLQSCLIMFEKLRDRLSQH